MKPVRVWPDLGAPRAAGIWKRTALQVFQTENDNGAAFARIILTVLSE
jgi:hypothetical protein